MNALIISTYSWCSELECLAALGLPDAHFARDRGTHCGFRPEELVEHMPLACWVEVQFAVHNIARADVSHVLHPLRVRALHAVPDVLSPPIPCFNDYKSSILCVELTDVIIEFYFSE